MANCTECGNKLGFFETGSGGLCNACNSVAAIGLSLHQEILEAKQKAEKFDKEIDEILLTTESNPDLNIAQRIEIVTAECAFGMNIFKDLFAGVRDIVGGRSEAVQNTLRDSRKTALYELKKEAYAVGANAVVGVDLDYVELSVSGSMVLLVASGTAVKIT